MYRKPSSGVKQGVKSVEQTSVRSTAAILNLFKKSAENSNKVIQREDVPCAKEENSIAPIKSSPITGSNKVIFNVVIGKRSNRKHKVWEDDGTLEVTGNQAILKDAEGNVIQRTTVKPETLEEGFRMCISNKEIEILERVTSECLPTKPEQEKVVGPPLKKLKTSNSKSCLPLASLHNGLKLNYESLIMPSISISKEWTEDVAPENETEVLVDACLANVLRPHQRYGVVFLYECIMGMKIPNYFGAILADEMGLGKTLQCITVIWTLLKKGPYGRPILNNVLIVTPSSLCNNWNKEFKNWLGYHRICPYVVDAKNKPNAFKKHPRNSVMIISYDMLIRSEEEIGQIDFDLIVCDEGHKLKNNNIKAAKILSNFNCKRKILLTGTPIQNDLQEFFALVDFVNSGILGNYSEFKSYYENPIVSSQCTNATPQVVSLGSERANELQEKTKYFILRRTQETINKYLPSKHELVIFCRLSDEQEDLYCRVTDSWFAKSSPDNSIPHLTVITALKKICNHPELFYNDKNELLNDLKRSNKNSGASSITRKEYCGKVSIVRTILRNLKNTDEKLVLISYYTQTLDLLENICNTENLQFLRLDGSVTSNVRLKIVERFNSRTDSSKVFLLSAKAGGVGLNLPGASRLILFDSDWNPASDSQAMARIWRDGQKKDVHIIRLLTAGTIEEKIFQRQISKAGLSETVVDSKSLASLKFSMSELKDLFTLTTDTNSTTHDLMKCTCNGYEEIDESSEESQQENDREYQLLLKDDTQKSNLTINQLLKWEHYEQPIPDKIIQEIMLSEISDNITFILKHSVLKHLD